jgi:hypothetical protein
MRIIKGKGAAGMKDVIVYRNRIEVKILGIVWSVIWVGLSLAVMIYEILTQRYAFWLNLKPILFLAFLNVIPILIIFRFRIIIDFDNRTITRIGYFSGKKKYSFDALNVSVEHKGILTFYVFSQKQKKLFEISEIDFEGQTNAEANRLKALFKGDAKRLYELECSMAEKGFYFAVYRYVFEGEIGAVSDPMFRYWIGVEFNATDCTISLKVWNIQIQEGMGHRDILVEQVDVSLDSLEENLLALAERYLQPL